MKSYDRQLQTAIIGFGLSGQFFHAPFLKCHPWFNLTKIVQRRGNLSKELYPDVEIIRDYKDLLKDDALELDIQQVVYNRYLGEILEFEAHFDRFAPGPRRSAWRNEPLPAGGVLYDLGSHLNDQALVLFGLPQAVFADIRSQKAESKVDDYFDIHLYYSKLKVLLKASMLVKEPGPRYIMHGSKGSFIKYGNDPQEAMLRQGLIPDSEDWGKEDPEYWGILNAELHGQQFYGTIETEAGNYTGFYDNVHDVITKGAEQAVQPEEARNVIRIIEIAFESHRSKSIVPLT